MDGTSCLHTGLRTCVQNTSKVQNRTASQSEYSRRNQNRTACENTGSQCNSGRTRSLCNFVQVCGQICEPVFACNPDNPGRTCGQICVQVCASPCLLAIPDNPGRTCGQICESVFACNPDNPGRTRDQNFVQLCSSLCKSVGRYVNPCLLDVWCARLQAVENVWTVYVNVCLLSFYWECGCSAGR
jgi:hypothetical protein